MRIKLTPLRTRVARQILGLFLLCGVVPVITIASVAYYEVSNELVRSATGELVKDSKFHAALVAARLQELVASLRGPIDSVPVGRRSVVTHLAGKPTSDGVFDGVAIESGRNQRSAGRGNLPPLPSLTTAEVARLELGEPVMIAGTGADAKSFFVVVPRGPRGTQFPRAWGHARVSGALLNLEAPPPGKQFCLFTDEGPVYCDSGANPAPLDLRSNLVGGTLRWKHRGTALLTGYVRLFLGYTFGAPPWYIALSETESDALAPLAVFRNIFGFGTVFVAVGIFLLSHVQIRRRMTPLAALTAGTKRLRSGDFSSRVQVSSRDEFQELAGSFNEMASELDRQFSTLETLHRVDRVALEGRSAAAISAAVILRLPLLLDAAAVAVVTAVGEDPHAWSADVVTRGRPEPDRVAVTVTDSELACLALTREWFVIPPGDQLPSYCQVAGPEPGMHVVVFPILHAGRPFGALIVAQRTTPHPRLVNTGHQIATQLALGLGNVKLLDELHALSTGALTALARTIDAASHWTSGHSERVSAGATAIARRMGMDDTSLTLLRRGGLLHDIGKIGVPTAILDKPGRLNDAELRAIQSHPVIGAGIVSSIAAFQDMVPLVLHHHELLDGTGYPHGLRGDQIPPIVRVLTVADVFDALVSDRPYREGLSSRDALAVLISGVNVKFDETAVMALEEVVRAEWAAEHAAGESLVQQPHEADVLLSLAALQEVG